VIDAPCIVQTGTIKSIRQWLLTNPMVLEVDHRGSHVNICGSTKNQDALQMLQVTLIDTLRTLVRDEMKGEVLEEQSQIWSPRAPSTAAIEFCKNVTAEFNPQGGDGEPPRTQVFTPYPKKGHTRKTKKAINLDFTTITDSASMNYAKAVQGTSNRNAKKDSNFPKMKYNNPDGIPTRDAVTPESQKQDDTKEGRRLDKTPSDFDEARSQWKAELENMEQRFTAGQSSLQKYMVELADKAKKEQEDQKARLDSITEAITEMLKSNIKTARLQEQQAKKQAEAMQQAIHNQQVDQQNHKQEVMEMFSLFQQQLMNLIKQGFQNNKMMDEGAMEDYPSDTGVDCGKVPEESENGAEVYYFQDSGEDIDEYDNESGEESDVQWSTPPNEANKKRKSLASPQTPDRDQAKGTPWKPSTHAQDTNTRMVDRAKKYE